jgi:mono/diheme cytochrome c family protein
VQPNAPAPRPGRNLRLVIFFLILAAIVIGLVSIAMQKRTWVIPEAAKQAKNPLAQTDQALTEGKKTFGDFCARCHGHSGKGDGTDAYKYNPSPGDLTDAKEMGKRTDGELFYIITAGKKPMPAFYRRLNDEQRWQLVLLIREMSRNRQ